VQASPAGEALLAVESSAMFVLIGSMPHTAGSPGRCRRTGKASSYRSMFEIGRPGAFPIGDVRSGSVKGVASALGDGAIAVQLMAQVVMDGLHPHRVARPTIR
jgi:thioredoxin reductase (NADPH)